MSSSTLYLALARVQSCLSVKQKDVIQLDLCMGVWVFPGTADVPCLPAGTVRTGWWYQD